MGWLDFAFGLLCGALIGYENTDYMRYYLNEVIEDETRKYTKGKHEKRKADKKMDYVYYAGMLGIYSTKFYFWDLQKGEDLNLLNVIDDFGGLFAGYVIGKKAYENYLYWKLKRRISKPSLGRP